MECKNYQQNLKRCNCSYEPCSRKGYCCECLAYHRRAGELPACFFPDHIERTYDRSPDSLRCIRGQSDFNGSEFMLCQTNRINRFDFRTRKPIHERHNLTKRIGVGT